MRILQGQTADHTHTLQEESMKKKTVRKLLKAQRKQRAQAQAPGLPWAMKEYVDRYFRQNIADFACSPREFYWRQLRRAAEAQRRRAG
jgi:hypothetical protein